LKHVIFLKSLKIWHNLYFFSKSVLNCYTSPKRMFYLQIINAVWKTIWIVVVSEIWRLGNNRILKGGVVDGSKVFALIQLKVWSWIACKVPLACFSYSNWCLNPLVCRYIWFNVDFECWIYLSYLAECYRMSYSSV